MDTGEGGHSNHPRTKRGSIWSQESLELYLVQSNLRRNGVTCNAPHGTAGGLMKFTQEREGEGRGGISGG